MKMLFLNLFYSFKILIPRFICKFYKTLAASSRISTKATFISSIAAVVHCHNMPIKTERRIIKYSNRAIAKVINSDTNLLELM